jgi:hypothetical protein
MIKIHFCQAVFSQVTDPGIAIINVLVRKIFLSYEGVFLLESVKTAGLNDIHHHHHHHHHHHQGFGRLFI